MPNFLAFWWPSRSRHIEHLFPKYRDVRSRCIAQPFREYRCPFPICRKGVMDAAEAGRIESVFDRTRMVRFKVATRRDRRSRRPTNTRYFGNAYGLRITPCVEILAPKMIGRGVIGTPPPPLSSAKQVPVLGVEAADIADKGVLVADGRAGRIALDPGFEFGVQGLIVPARTFRPQ